MRRAILLSLIMLVTIPSFAMSVTRYVNPGSGTIEAVIAISNPGDTLVLNEGVYTGRWGVGDCPGPWKRHYPLDPNGKNLKFRSTDPNDPNVVAGTIISVFSPLPECAPPPEPNQLRYACYFANGEGPSCQLIGLTIKTGADSYANIWWVEPEESAIYCSGTSPVIRKCMIRGGSYGRDLIGIDCNDSGALIKNCDFFGNTFCRDGAINIRGNSDITIEGCSIIGNDTTDDYDGILHTGGNVDINNCTIADNKHTGIYSITSGTANITINNSIISGNQPYGIDCRLQGGGNLTMSNCTVANNHYSGFERGIGLQIRGQTDALIEDCTFSGNIGKSLGGGVYIDACNEATFRRCTITANQAGEGGGFMSLSGSVGPVLISNCTISDNIAMDPINGKGGGISNMSQQLTVENCKITGNKTLTPGLNSGGGGISSSRGLIIRNCLITGNETASCGGGIEIMNDYDGYITNCTIADNYAADEGGGIYTSWWYSTDDVYIKNCIVWGNDAPASKQIHNRIGTRLHVDYSDIEDGWTSGTGNMNLDPRFIADYHLRLDSPCIDVGDPALNYDGQTDIDGDNRVIDIAGKGDGIVDVDIGADEYTGLSTGITGAGIYCNNASPTIKNCVIVDNYTTGSGGGMYCENSASPAIINCVFSENWAEWYGGGIVNIDSSPILTNCVFSKNSAGYGGGILNQGASATMNAANCILWDNIGGEIENIDGATANLTYCDVKGSYSGTGNIDSDPNFIDANEPAGPDDVFRTFDDGLRLWTISPCIDAGDPSTDSNDVGTVDIGGDYRFMDGDHDGNNVIDMGAYELPRIWYVDANVQDGNGLSWATAYDDLQDALTDANDGDEIWVAEGIYEPNDSGDRSISFNLVNGVGVYGGFDGNEICLIERDWAKNKTILSGDINEPNDANDNSFHVVTGSGVGQTAVLDGFIITGGNADGSPSYDRGGGMYYYSGSPTVANCTFRDNLGTYAAGMYNRNCFSTITNCFFANNSSTQHTGGMRNYNSNPTLVNCVFSGNSAAGSGGGMYNGSGSSPTVTNCTFTGNSASGSGGGIYNAATSSSPKITNCIFWDNSDSGGKDQSAQIHGGTPTVNYSCIQAWSGGGNGNTNNDPCFVDIDDPNGPDDVFGTLDDGLRLTADSPCIDAADGNFAPWTDILDLERVDINDVNNTGVGDPNYADMGAYEFISL